MCVCESGVQNGTIHTTLSETTDLLVQVYLCTFDCGTVCACGGMCVVCVCESGVQNGTIHTTLSETTGLLVQVYFCTSDCGTVCACGGTCVLCVCESGVQNLCGLLLVVCTCLE